jgi:oligoribonuclease
MPAAHHACERMNADSHADRLIWIDLEMTGLDTDRDGILEIATVVTDGDLNVLAEGPECAIAHPLATLEAMDDWNRTQHGKSGLWRRVLEEGVALAEAEARTLASCANGCPPVHRRCAAIRSARIGASCTG